MRTDAESNRHRVLVVGVARSGTTWISEALGKTPGTFFVHEPDNIHRDPFAAIGIRDQLPDSRLPAEGSRDYALMWDLAFAGGWPTTGPLGGAASRALSRLPLSLRSPVVRPLARLLAQRAPHARNIVAKTVRGVFTVEWLAQRYGPTVLVIDRNPLNTVSSWMGFGWDARAGLFVGNGQLEELLSPVGQWPPPADAGVVNAAWTVSALRVTLLRAAARHPEWTVVRHEEVALSPAARMRELMNRVGLEWGPAVDAYLEERNRPGEAFDVQRVAALEADRWRTRLSADAAAEAMGVIASFEALVPAGL